jgi:capsular exopolysaccharide synthesis family protein
MELRQYYFMFRRWFWLFILGGILGGVGAYIGSWYQTPVYQSSSQVMISPPSREQLTELGYLSGQQLIQTYAQLIVTDPVLEEVSRRVNDPISEKQITVQQMRDTQILKVTVEDSDPLRAAEVSNLLTEVLVENNEMLQASRFAASEGSLLSQIQVVETQIANLESEIAQESQETYDTEKKQVEEQIGLLQEEIVNLQLEIASLSPAEVPPDTEQSTPGLVNPQDLSLLQEKQLHLEQRQGMLDLYQEIYFNLISSNGTGDYGTGQIGGGDQSQNTLALYQQIYANLLGNYEEVRLSRLENTPTVVQVEPGKPSKTPVRPRPLTNTFLGCVVGLMIAGGVAFLIEYLDDTIKSPEDVERVSNLPLIGYIAEMQLSQLDGKGVVYIDENPRSPIAEAFRYLRTNLDFENAANPIRTILVTSPGPAEGKSTVASNLATAMVQGGKRVVLLDADLRKPYIHQIFNLENRLGLSEYLNGQATLHEIAKIKDQAKKLVVIPSGKLPPNPTEILRSEKIQQVMDGLSASTDYIIVDSPPLLVSDPVVISARVDGVLLVVQPGQTKQNDVVRAVDQLSRANARVLGIVFNRITRQTAYYYQGYYADYYSYYKHTPGEGGEEGIRRANLGTRRNKDGRKFLKGLITRYGGKQGK